jgi:hypothetical protein
MKAHPQYTPSVDTMFMAAMAMVLLCEKSFKIFKVLLKYETLTLTSKISILQEKKFKELTLVLLESLF